MQDFHVRLRAIRKVNKATQKQAAVAAGVTERNYQDWEYGNTKPGFDSLIALANFFNVTVDYLVGNGLYGKLSDHPDAKPILQKSIDTLLGKKLLSKMNIDSISELPDPLFCQIAASLIKDFSFDENGTLTIYWNI